MRPGLGARGLDINTEVEGLCAVGIEYATGLVSQIMAGGREVHCDVAVK